MHKIDLHKEFQRGREENIVFELRGLISQDILVGFVELIKDKIFLNTQKNRLVRKIFPIFIELFQNIVRHSIDENGKNHKKDGIGRGIILLKANTEYYFISSGNYINNNNVKKMTNLINKINELDEQELKSFYKERLRRNRGLNRNNSGVGLIDIARKSGNPIELNIKEIDTLLSFCEITVKINK